MGRFGCGLKEAIAVLHSRGHVVTITSKFLEATVISYTKTGFDLDTLHAKIDTGDSNLVGTAITITGITEEHVEAAKSFFLRYVQLGDIVHSNNHGTVYSVAGRVAINGQFVFRSSQLAYSYNVTKVQGPLSKIWTRRDKRKEDFSWTSLRTTLIKILTTGQPSQRLLDDFASLPGREFTWTDVIAHLDRPCIVPSTELTKKEKAVWATCKRVIDQGRFPNVRKLVVHSKGSCRLDAGELVVPRSGLQSLHGLLGLVVKENAEVDGKTLIVATGEQVERSLH
jgi:hypothetical protein